MSTRAEKLRQKREEQAKLNAAHKAAREQEKKQLDTPEELKKRLVTLENELKEVREASERLHKNAEDLGVAYVTHRGPPHFMGAGSTALNELRSDLCAKSARLSAAIEKIKDKLDPERVVKREQQKTRNQAVTRMWSAMFAYDRRATQQAEEQKKKPTVEVKKYLIERKKVSLILAKDTPIRCYHLTPQGTYENCDCKRVPLQHGGERLILSDRCENLRTLGELEVDDSAVVIQNLMLETSPAKDPMFPNYYGGPLALYPKN